MLVAGASPVTTAPSCRTWTEGPPSAPKQEVAPSVAQTEVEQSLGHNRQKLARSGEMGEERLPLRTDQITPTMLRKKPQAHSCTAEKPSTRTSRQAVLNTAASSRSARLEKDSGCKMRAS